MERMLGENIPMIMLTDSKQLFDILVRAKRTAERRLMVDISAAREAYNDEVISNIALIRSEFNLADALTNIGGNDALDKFLQTFTLNHPVEQYIIKTKTTSALRHQKPGCDNVLSTPDGKVKKNSGTINKTGTSMNNKDPTCSAHLTTTQHNKQITR